MFYRYSVPLRHFQATRNPTIFSKLWERNHLHHSYKFSVVEWEMGKNERWTAASYYDGHAVALLGDYWTAGSLNAERPIPDAYMMPVVLGVQPIRRNRTAAHVLPLIPSSPPFPTSPCIRYFFNFPNEIIFLRSRISCSHCRLNFFVRILDSSATTTTAEKFWRRPRSPKTASSKQSPYPSSSFRPSAVTIFSRATLLPIAFHRRR